MCHMRSTILQNMRQMCAYLKAKPSFASMLFGSSYELCPNTAPKAGLKVCPSQQDLPKARAGFEGWRELSREGKRENNLRQQKNHVQAKSKKWKIIGLMVWSDEATPGAVMRPSCQEEGRRVERESPAFQWSVLVSCLFTHQSVTQHWTGLP